MLDKYAWKTYVEPLEAAQLYLSSFFTDHYVTIRRFLYLPKYVSLIDNTHSSKKKAEISYAIQQVPLTKYPGKQGGNKEIGDTRHWHLITCQSLGWTCIRARIVSLTRIRLSQKSMKPPYQSMSLFLLRFHCFETNLAKKSHLDWSALHLFGHFEMGMKWITLPNVHKWGKQVLQDKSLFYSRNQREGASCH